MEGSKKILKYGLWQFWEVGGRGGSGGTEPLLQKVFLYLKLSVCPHL